MQAIIHLFDKQQTMRCNRQKSYDNRYKTKCSITHTSCINRLFGIPILITIKHGIRLNQTNRLRYHLVNITLRQRSNIARHQRFHLFLLLMRQRT